MDGLPAGSMYVRATCPERRWSEERELATDIRQAVMDAAEALGGVPPEERTRIARPWDEAIRKLREAEEVRKAEEAMRAGEYIRTTKWEAV